MAGDVTGLLTGGALGFALGASLGTSAGSSREGRDLARELDRAMAFGNTLGEVGLVAGERRSLDIAAELNPALPARAYVLAEQRWYLWQGGAWVPDQQTQADYAEFDLELYLAQLREHRAISAEGVAV